MKKSSAYKASVYGNLDPILSKQKDNSNLSSIRGEQSFENVEEYFYVKKYWSLQN